MYRSIHVFYEGRMETDGFPSKGQEIRQDSGQTQIYFALFSCIVAQHKQTKKNVSAVRNPTVPFSANVWIASQAFTRMSSSGELSNSTTVAGFFPSTGSGSNWQRGERRVNALYLCCIFIVYLMSVPVYAFRIAFSADTKPINASQTRKLHSSKE